MVAATVGSAATQAPAATATAADAPAAPATHQRALHTAVGNTTAKKRTRSRQAGTWAPVTAERERATSEESRPTRAGSGEADCTTDRDVAARW